MERFFCPKERMAEKQRQRDQDDADLREGRVTREELRLRNGLFSGLDIDWSKAKIIVRPDAWL